MENNTRAPQFTAGQIVRVVYHHTALSKETKVLHVGKRHIIVEWPDFSSKEARFNLRPTYGCWSNDYIAATLHPAKEKQTKEVAAEITIETYCRAVNIVLKNRGAGALTQQEIAGLCTATYADGYDAGICAQGVVDDRWEASAEETENKCNVCDGTGRQPHSNGEIPCRYCAGTAKKVHI